MHNLRYNGGVRAVARRRQCGPIRPSGRTELSRLGRHYMTVHVLLDTMFFRSSMPIGPQQRLLPLPSNRGLNEGDTIFLRNEAGSLTWVADVLATGEVDSTEGWAGGEAKTERYAITGYLARIHEGVLPPGKSRLQSPWVTLNRRTLENTLPWWDTHVLLFHSTLHLVEGLLTLEEVREGLRLNCLMQHPSGHIVVPHGEARKRLLVQVRGVQLQCGLCHGPIASLEEATQDHVIPISQGGPDTLANIELAHRTCNELKGNALPEQYPPFFPVPGTDDGSWRNGSFRNGRHVHQRRGRRNGAQTKRPRYGTGLVTAPVRGTGVPTVAQEEPVLEPVGAPAETAAASNGSKPHMARERSRAQDQRGANEQSSAAGSPATANADNKLTENQPEKEQDRKNRKDATTENGSPRTDNAESNAKGGAVQVDPEWLAKVQRCNWEELTKLAGERDWAAKTAALRTLEQLSRAEGKAALAEGTLLIEDEGPKGRFQLFSWRDQIVLTEERGNRRSFFLVKELAAITWETYIWYLKYFGRTTPLAVAMSLLALWRQGNGGADNRVRADKNDRHFEMTLTDGQLHVNELEAPSDVA